MLREQLVRQRAQVGLGRPSQQPSRERGRCRDRAPERVEQRLDAREAIVQIAPAFVVHAGPCGGLEAEHDERAQRVRARALMRARTRAHETLHARVRCGLQLDSDERPARRHLHFSWVNRAGRGKSLRINTERTRSGGARARLTLAALECLFRGPSSADSCAVLRTRTTRLGTHRVGLQDAVEDRPKRPLAGARLRQA